RAASRPAGTTRCAARSGSGTPRPSGSRDFALVIPAEDDGFHLVAELLDQVEAVVLGGYDQREVTFLHERVGTAGAVASFDLVPAQPHPVVLVDHAGGEHADIRVAILGRHE